MFEEAVHCVDELRVSFQNVFVEFATYHEEGVTHLEARRASRESRYRHRNSWMAHLHELQAFRSVLGHGFQLLAVHGVRP